MSQQRPLPRSLPRILARPSAPGVKGWRPSLAPPLQQSSSPKWGADQRGRGAIAGARGSPPRRRGVCPGYLLSLRPTPRAPEQQTQSPPWGCPGERATRSATWVTEAALPGLARSRDSRRDPPPPSPFPRRLRLLPLPPPSPLPVGAELRSEQRSARHSLDVGSGQVLRASSRDGQPLHQRHGHRGLEPAECSHPGHTRGGVGVLQVRTRLSFLPSIRVWWHLTSAPGTTRLGAGEKLHAE